MIIDDYKCGLCGSEIPKFKIKSSEGMHKACICIIAEGIDGFSGFLECLCNECFELNAKEMAVICNALSNSSEPAAKSILRDFKSQIKK